MMLHPDQLLELGRQRQETLLASSRPFTIITRPDRPGRPVRRRIGLAMVRLGAWLGGPMAVPRPPARLSTPLA